MDLRSARVSVFAEMCKKHNTILQIQVFVKNEHVCKKHTPNNSNTNDNNLDHAKNMNVNGGSQRWPISVAAFG